MGLIPFIMLGVAIKKSQEQHVYKPTKQTKKRDYYSSTSSYNKQKEYIHIQLEEIENEQTRQFVEDLIAYRKDKIVERTAKLKTEIEEANETIKEYNEELKPLKEKIVAATETFIKCMDEISPEDRELLGYDPIKKTSYYSYGTESQRYISLAEKKLHELATGITYDQITSFANGNTSYLNYCFDFEAVQGIPLEESNFFKDLNKRKDDCKVNLSNMEAKLSFLQTKLKRTVWLPKRKELKEDINKLTKNINIEKTYLPKLEKIIDTYLKYYQVVASLNEEEKQELAKVVHNGISKQRNSIENQIQSVEYNIRQMERTLETVDKLRVEKFVEDFVSEHPQYTEETLGKIKGNLKETETKKRDKIGEETHVYNYSKPTMIGDTIETKILCDSIERVARHMQTK